MSDKQESLVEGVAYQCGSKFWVGKRLAKCKHSADHRADGSDIFSYHKSTKKFYGAYVVWTDEQAAEYDLRHQCFVPPEEATDGQG